MRRGAGRGAGRFIVTRPNLPVTRDERIALAHRTIGGCCGPEDQLLAGHQQPFGQPGVVSFQVLTPSEATAGELGIKVAKALLVDAGFKAVSFGPSKDASDGLACSIRVPVGAP